MTTKDFYTEQELFNYIDEQIVGNVSHTQRLFTTNTLNIYNDLGISKEQIHYPISDKAQDVPINDCLTFGGYDHGLVFIPDNKGIQRLGDALDLFDITEYGEGLIKAFIGYFNYEAADGMTAFLYFPPWCTLDVVNEWIDKVTDMEIKPYLDPYEEIKFHLQITNTGKDSDHSRGLTEVRIDLDRKQDIDKELEKRVKDNYRYYNLDTVLGSYPYL